MTTQTHIMELESSLYYIKKNIHQRILAIMEDVDKVIKEDKKVNNQYTFVSHDAVSRIMHPLFVKHGVTMIPSVRQITQDGNRAEMEIDITFHNVDEPSEYILTKSVGYGIDSQDKGPGKAYSYAVKMAVLKLFVLESGEKEDGPSDPDIEKDVKTDYKPNIITEKQAIELIKLAGTKGYDAGALDAWCQDHYKVKGVYALKAKDYNKALIAINKLQKDIPF